jgi:hypothetical protein
LPRFRMESVFLRKHNRELCCWHLTPIFGDISANYRKKFKILPYGTGVIRKHFYVSVPVTEKK